MPQIFSQKNFRGQSFIKKDLSEYDFNNADIRGANFTNCSLVNKNFSNAKTGLKLSWAIVLITIIILLALIAGVMIGYGGGFPAFIMSIKPKSVSNQVVWFLISTGFLILISCLLIWFSFCWSRRCLLDT